MDKLKAWKNKEDRKPMVLMGARQVGKTWLMKEFGKEEYAKVAYISFYNNAKMNDVFAMDLSIPLSEVHAIRYRSPHNPLKKSIFFKS